MSLARLPQNRQTLTMRDLSFSYRTDDKGEPSVSSKPIDTKAVNQ